jgi:hypothetical protein
MVRNPHAGEINPMACSSVDPLRPLRKDAQLIDALSIFPSTGAKMRRARGERIG